MNINKKSLMLCLASGTITAIMFQGILLYNSFKGNTETLIYLVNPVAYIYLKTANQCAAGSDCDYNQDNLWIKYDNVKKTHYFDPF